MGNFTRASLFLLFTSLIYVTFNEASMITLNQGTILPGSITLISFLLYGPTCYYMARNLEFGKWRYIFYIPFINELLYILGIYTFNIRKYFPLEEDNFGVGMMILPLTIIMWLIFIGSTFLGIMFKKKHMNELQNNI
jgi:hypothetical protein